MVGFAGCLLVMMGGFMTAMNLYSALLGGEVEELGFGLRLLLLGGVLCLPYLWLQER